MVPGTGARPRAGTLTVHVRWSTGGDRLTSHHQSSSGSAFCGCPPLTRSLSKPGLLPPGELGMAAAAGGYIVLQHGAAASGDSLGSAGT